MSGAALAKIKQQQKSTHTQNHTKTTTKKNKKQQQQQQKTKQKKNNNNKKNNNKLNRKRGLRLYWNDREKYYPFIILNYFYINACIIVK